MKIFTRQVLGMATLWLAGTLTLAAQETHSETKVIVVQKVAREDGNQSVTKIEIKETELATYLESLKKTDGKNVEIHLSTQEGENIRISPDENGTLLYVREANPKAAGLRKISESIDTERNTKTWNYSYDHNGTTVHKKISTYPATAAVPATSSRPILGIYADEDSDEKGIVIGSLSTSKGVAAAGLKAGDVITVVDGKTVTNSADLRSALANHKPGDKVTVTYLRNGKPVQAEVALAGEGGSRVSMERDPCRVFIGVGTSQRSGDGLHVDYIVENTPAEVSDVRAGDVILSLDQVAVSTQAELESERDKHQPGEEFTLNILRNDQPMTIKARFKACSQEEMQKAAEEKEKQLAERQDWMSYVREVRPQVERDPCAVFIGIYSHSVEDGGRQIDGVIKGTPAETSKLQKGDIILAMDDVKVSSHTELVRERDKHSPGDRFTLAILRNGEYLEVDAQFKACGEEPKEEAIPTQIVETTVPETTAPAIQPIVAPDRQLKIQAWNAYPNPTYGNVNVQFQGEAVPTTLQVVDATGKVVYEENLNRFDGAYQKQLNLANNMPGVYLLVVRQGEKVFYNKVVLLSKA